MYISILSCYIYYLKRYMCVTQITLNTRLPNIFLCFPASCLKHIIFNVCLCVCTRTCTHMSTWHSEHEFRRQILEVESLISLISSCRSQGSSISLQGPDTSNFTSWAIFLHSASALWGNIPRQMHFFQHWISRTSVGCLLEEVSPMKLKARHLFLAITISIFSHLTFLLPFMKDSIL